MDQPSVSVKHAFSLPLGTAVTLRGWVRSRRDSKGITFIELNDGSRFKSMQLVVESGAVADETAGERVARARRIHHVGGRVGRPVSYTHLTLPTKA